MADKTGIEWTDATWNPTTGCDQVSPGCDNCYALTLAKRLKAMGSAHYQRDGDPETSGPGFGLTMHPDALDKPLRWTRSRRIFVNSMSDLFHKDVTDEFIARVFAVMALTPRHTFQVLTKRHARMHSLLSSPDFRESVAYAATLLAVTEARRVELGDGWESEYVPQYGPRWNPPWPLPNVWLGVSVENQKWADIRVPALLDTPAAVRFLSCEPLLGSVDLDEEWLAGPYDCGCDSIDWVIVGGESGPGARPMHEWWARSLRDQCITAGVPFLFKQWGSHDEYGTPMGKHNAGRTLDGRTWDEYPTVVTA